MTHGEWSAFHLPQDVLTEIKAAGPGAAVEVHAEEKKDSATLDLTKGCALCGVSVLPDEQRTHARSDWHRFNLKRRMRGAACVREEEFEAMLETLDESLSGSDSESDDVSALVKKHASVDEDDEQETKGKLKGSPYLWFAWKESYVGIYKALFLPREQEKPVASLRRKQIDPAAPPRHMLLLMLGGGHFAGMVVTPSSTPSHPSILAHKTFHRYTTRRKQGGAQSAADAGKSIAGTAGSALRRYNEQALEAEVRELLRSWQGYIDAAERIFIRAVGTAKKIISGYEGAPIAWRDERVASFPFSTRRPTQKELVRCFAELMRVKVTTEDILAPTKTVEKKEAKPPLEKKKEKQAPDHHANLTALVRRGRVPALQAYLHEHGLSTGSLFVHHHTPTLLHMAASLNQPAIVFFLLASSDPSLQNSNGKTPFELCGERPARDAFRVARSELLDRWDWEAARVPSPLSPSDLQRRHALEQEKAQRETEREAQRRKVEEERLRQAQQEQEARQQRSKPERRLGADVSVQGMAEGGLSQEARTRLERERRARAAEARMSGR